MVDATISTIVGGGRVVEAGPAAPGAVTAGTALCAAARASASRSEEEEEADEEEEG